MFIMKSVKREKNGRNRTAKPWKSQDAWREGKLQVFWNFGSRHHQASADEDKIKRVPQKKEKTSQNHALLQKSHQRYEHLHCHS